MLPLSLSTPLTTRGLTGGLSGGLLSAPALDAAKPQLATTSTGGPLNSAAMMPMILQLLQGIIQLIQSMFGGAPAGTGNAGNAGNGGTTGNAGGAGNAGGVGTTGGAGNAGNTGGLYGGTAPTGTGNAGNSTPGAGTPGAPADQTDPTTVNYSQIAENQRAAFTHLDDNATPEQERTDAAIIHLGGRAHISDAPTASGVSPTARIYNNVLDNPQNFKPEEVALIQQYAAKEKQETASLTPDGQGFVTGKYLDYAFIEQMGSRDGVSQDKMNQYKAAVDARVAKITDPTNPNLNQVIADSKTEVNIVSDINTLQQRTGLTPEEQAAYRLAGHSVLFSQNGQVDGEILGISYQNGNALDSQAGAGQNVNIDPQIEALAAADKADDGQLNGSSLRRADEQVLDKLYLGGPGIQNTQQIGNDAMQAGLQNGRSVADIQQALTSGGAQALQDLKNMAKNHSPAMLAAGATMAGAAAVCPFLGGMAAGAIGIGAGQKALQNK